MLAISQIGMPEPAEAYVRQLPVMVRAVAGQGAKG